MMNLHEDSPKETWIIAYNRVCDSIKRLSAAFLEIPKMQDEQDRIKQKLADTEKILDQTRDNLDELALSVEALRANFRDTLLGKDRRIE